MCSSFSLIPLIYQTVASLPSSHILAKEENKVLPDNLKLLKAATLFCSIIFPSASSKAGYLGPIELELLL